MAERIRTFIEESFIMSGEEKISVTASIGATLGRPGDTVDSVMERVDRMMCTSKEFGRNRVAVG